MLDDVQTILDLLTTRGISFRFLDDEELQILFPSVDNPTVISASDESVWFIFSNGILLHVIGTVQ